MLPFANITTCQSSILASCKTILAASVYNYIASCVLAQKYRFCHIYPKRQTKRETMPAHGMVDLNGQDIATDYRQTGLKLARIDIDDDIKQSNHNFHKDQNDDWRGNISRSLDGHKRLGLTDPL